MSEDIKRQIKLLVELQALDTKRLNLTKKLDKIPILMGELDSRLTAFEQEAQSASENAEALKKEYRELDIEVQSNQAKINKSDEKLSQVKNNKEYHAILKEIDDLKEKNLLIEDNMLEILDNIESEDQRVGVKKEELKQLSTEIAGKKACVEKDGLQWGKELAELSDDRSSVIENIAPQYLKTFEQVKKIVGVIAIARVVDSLCLGCNMNIPPQRYNELQRFDDIQLCPNCHRIIYWENTNDGSE